MFYLIKSTLPLAISLFFVILINRNYTLLENSKRFLTFFCFAWITIFLVQYFILGPYSSIHYWDEADIALSRILHDKYFHLGGKFAHNIQGGVDFYSAQLFGGQYISLERFLFSIFPVWIALFIHKLNIIIFSFFGSYLLFKKVFQAKIIDSLCLSSFISIINPYAVYSTLHHGLGYAVIPFSIYIYLYLTDKKYYFFVTTIFSILIASSTSAVHSFPAVFGGILLSYFILKPKRPKNFIISVSLLLIIVLINWSEAIYGYYDYGQVSARMFSEAHSNYFNIFGSVPYLIGKTNYCFIDCKFEYSSTLIILVILSLAVLKKFKNDYVNIIIFILVCIYLSAIGYAIIDLFDIQSIQAINFYNFSFYIYIPISFLALKIAYNNRDNILSKIPLVFLFFAISALVTDKIDNAKQIFFEPQKTITSIPNLVDKKWLTEKNLFRAVTTVPYIGFHPNFLWTYGFETLDGYTNIIPRKMTNFWRYGLHKNKHKTSDKELFGGDLYITYTNQQASFAKGLKYSSDQTIDLNNLVDVNMLRLTNTAYIMSYFDLKEDGLIKVSGPDKNPFPISHNFNLKRDINYYKKSILEKKDNIFNPKEIFIYQISDYYDRLFFSKKIIKSEKELDVREQYEFISQNYIKHAIYLSKAPKNRKFDSISLINNTHKIGKGSILNIEKVKDGYEAFVNVTENGLLVLNQLPILKFWKAYVDNQETKILKINNIQMGIVVPNGKHKINFSYERKLLREKMFDFLKNY